MVLCHKCNRRIGIQYFLIDGRKVKLCEKCEQEELEMEEEE